jgi:threonyl-tRNA synthetase
MKKQMKNNNLDNLRHSAAHLLAAAVMELWPDAKRTIGPSIENGFYFDFDFEDTKVTEEDFPAIEQKMLEILPSWKGFTGKEVSKDEALEEYKDNEYKKELIEEFAGEGQTLTFYQSGDYSDLCRGGHVKDPRKELKHFKLLSVAGAYWRGDEKNKMLTRIYGTIFPNQEELEKYLFQQEEAKKRDHRKLGKELDLFVFSDLVGSGLPLFTPKGAMLRELLNDFSQGIRLKRGFQRVWIPHITKSDLYKVSGHWDKFGDELFLVKSQETSDQLVMKPMNCPHHQQIYASKQRSYRDLPIMYLETTTIYRDEKAGELLGLSRVRSATQDDSHTFCTTEQIEDVYQMLIDVIKEFYDALGMKYRARLSFRDPKQPDKYLGEVKLWDKAQKILLDIAVKNKLDYFEAPGEAAFYGPKIDFMVTDALGREWQLATPQLDFVQPSRFGLTYIDNKGQEQTPVMIHFALMGSIERFLSVYIEHTAGAFPVWLAPVQVKILPITDAQFEYSRDLVEQLKKVGVRVEIDERSEKLGAKIRDAQMEKVPYMVIVGAKEVEAKKVSVRLRTEIDLGQLDLTEFIERVQSKISKKSLNL